MTHRQAVRFRKRVNRVRRALKFMVKHPDVDGVSQASLPWNVTQAILSAAAR